MVDLARMFENLKVAIVASDDDFKVLYANPRCKQLFKEVLKMEDFVGKHMKECHKPRTMEKLERLYQDYAEKKRKLDYYTMDVAEGKLTIVNVPFYDGETFEGVVEFIFESSLA